MIIIPLFYVFFGYRHNLLSVGLLRITSRLQVHIEEDNNKFFQVYFRFLKTNMEIACYTYTHNKISGLYDKMGPLVEDVLNNDLVYFI